MFRSNSGSTTSPISPTPISPFSSHSVPSEPTSDELPDLGAFNIVLREYQHFQPNARSFAAQADHSGRLQTLYTRSSSSFDPDSDSELRQPRSTVWSHRPIASYLASGETGTTDSEATDHERPSYRPRGRYTTSSSQPSTAIQDTDVNTNSSSDTEGEPESRTVPINDISEFDYNSSFNDSYDDDHYDDDLDDLEGDQVLKLNSQMHSLSVDDIQGETPSLGYLDEALSFLAAERERFLAQREANQAPGTDQPRRKRRRKRTKTPRGHSTTRTNTTSTSSSFPSAPGDEDPDEDSSSSYDHQYSTTNSNNNSSESYVMHKSTPGTPSRRGRPRRNNNGSSNKLSLRNSRSTPQLRLLVNEEQSITPQAPRFGEETERVKEMKVLASKLGTLFPEDVDSLERIRFTTLPPSEREREGKELDVLAGFVDTRGPAPTSTDKRLIHVFVDHSNILIGLVNYLRRHPRQHPQFRQQSNSSPSASPIQPSIRTKHLSHSALTLILERGRPVTRRVVCASSPLYQPMESAELLGFEVKVFARVPDMGDGADRMKGNGHRHSRSISNGAAGSSSPAGGGVAGDISSIRPKWRRGSVSGGGSGSGSGGKKTHSRKVSGSASAESEQGGGSGSGGNNAGAGFPQAFARTLGSPPNGAAAAAVSASLPASFGVTSNSPSGPVSASATPPRIRYREQGVDELLQLKLHQALASVDGQPPPDSTIILATGDGNVGQFNEDGFLGGVRTALKKGWKVELYAWEDGLSRAWKREFGEGSEWGGGADGKEEPRFRVIGMEQFGAELVEVYQ